MQRTTSTQHHISPWDCLPTADRPVNVWVGLRASDYEMFHQFMPISYVISVDDEPSISFPYLSVEAITRHRTNWSNDELETVVNIPGFNEMLKTLAEQSRPVNILSYYSLPELELLANRHSHIRLLAASSAMKRALDDKFRLSTFLHAIGLPSIPSQVMSLNTCNYKALSESFGPNLVARFRVSASGSGTFPISNAADLDLLHSKYRDQLVSVSPWLLGPSFNINGFIGTTLYLAPPSVQLVGNQHLGNLPFGYCGNDYSAMAYMPESLVRDIFSTAGKLGSLLQREGYRGIFGLDFLYDASLDTLHAIEINPRFQGSTPTLTRYHLSRMQQTLVHFFQIDMPESCNFEPVNASFMLLHNRRAEPLKIGTHIPSGVYRYAWTDDHLHLERLADGSLFPMDSSQLLITGCPQRNAIVDSGASLLRIEVLGSVLDSKCLQLQDEYVQIIMALEQLIKKEVHYVRPSGNRISISQ